MAILSDLRGCASLSDLLGATGAVDLWLEAELGVGAGVDVDGAMGIDGVDDLDDLNGMDGASSTSRTFDPCRDDDDDAGLLVLVGVRVQVTDLEDLPTERGAEWGAVGACGDEVVMAFSL